MTVEVVEVHDKYLLVKPTDSPNTKELLTLSMEYIDTDVAPSVGMKYEVTYTDGILETYPEQFGNVTKVTMVSGRLHDVLQATGLDVIDLLPKDFRSQGRSYI